MNKSIRFAFLGLAVASALACGLATEARASPSPAVPGYTEEIMKKQTPTIGRIVLYTLTAAEAESINSRRADAKRAMEPLHLARPIGVQLHVGNSVAGGEVYPLLICRVWPASDGKVKVNGQVLLDGSDHFWATSVEEGDMPGDFAWPKIDKPVDVALEVAKAKEPKPEQDKPGVAAVGKKPAPADSKTG